MGINMLPDRSDLLKAGFQRPGEYVYPKLNVSMLTPHLSGLTGVIQFDNDGFRSEFELDILELDEIEVLKKVKLFFLLLTDC